MARRRRKPSSVRTNPHVPQCDTSSNDFFASCAAVAGDAALSDSNPAELKRAYAALTAAVLEATRVDLDEAGFV